jgi:phosphohistidine phosphatase SixA
VTAALGARRDDAASEVKPVDVQRPEHMNAERRVRTTGRPIVAAMTALLCLAAGAAEAQSLVLIVRHAERADGGAKAGGMMAANDPPLSEAGTARAAKLADMLAEAGIDAIFSTEFRRTQDTVKPLAQRTGLTVTTVPARDHAGLIARLKASKPDDVLLVAGHSNTVPAIIGAMGGPKVTIGDADYGDLFVLVPATGTLSRIKF